MGSGGAIHNAANGILSSEQLHDHGKQCHWSRRPGRMETISGHGAAAQGGGIANFGNLTIVHCTVANNAAFGGDSSPGIYFGPYDGGASSGGGLYCASDSVFDDRVMPFWLRILTVGGAPSGPPAVAGAATGPDVNGAITSEGHNLLGRSDGCTGFTSDDQQGGTTDDTRLDPMLGHSG